ncbi:hypothetical protein GCM10025868_18970 [Angustibacter aerolatus]|uniref:PPM-type phosphatase domain-containing protein n=1 Tax=Angustibacter aerolatus TaxID=1162965 RepID=A0ABQ6JFS4_9ACTN|nr:PP2C family protein-serine/threonine phosphatase [Angustibacter aerolatus]GMA86647.1 hypothetical protein GCM10025868_18970 [Angustibacter aerolatus]
MRDDYLGLLRLVARTIVQALDRIAARAGDRSMSESMQRVLLARPVTSPGLEVAVRYEAASATARIGGDWYDAFVPPDGPTTLVVGDVAGHDQHAAAAMSQVRNLLRGVAAAAPSGPAGVLTVLDGTIDGLGVGIMATAVLAQLDPPLDDGSRVLRWSNAGHPPPVLVEPDGTARLLETTPDPLLGVLGYALTDDPRREQTRVLAPGSTLVLFTDGLVERRDVGLQEGFDRLRAALEQTHEARRRAGSATT